MRRTVLLLLSLLPCLSPVTPAEAAREVTLKARILEIDTARDRVRADVAGRATSYRVASSGVLRGFRKGDLVVLRVRGGTVIDARMAFVSGQVVRADDKTAVVRINGRNERLRVGNGDARKRLKQGDFVRLEIEERRDGSRVITRVY